MTPITLWQTLQASGAPLIPDGDEGRRWAERELADPVYDEARPTAFDRFAQAVGEWFANLFQVDVPGGVGATFALVAAGIVIVVIVAAFLIWGVPRRSRRAHARTLALFDEDDARSAAQLRADAADAAARERWDEAIVLRFRALARGVVERGVVSTPPGATVHAFARAAGRVFPACAGDLERSATAFDDVRYLRRPGTEELYRVVADTDAAIERTRPSVLAEVPG
ncbi:DUF4129 domain-containing protein [Microbacterium thalassium]|uniref:Protein-glutamine gamma-glutamyltransferase-like C-terminal domain-containing protein n=1 Tax=Microbacterium thalassium TaxID=362649 RepID=A0A7X0KUN0_9MICO|nr:DUF4129 domain-containing protein [Microbacterium thalassium]MBB6391337.1 hypothetical protein [Microbacterium thalassium]GLK23366.1 hypothetical protein GCM10017607_06840 [Microbacterium thalassium]